MALRVLLLLIVTLFLPQTRVWGFENSERTAPGVFAAVLPVATGENDVGWAYDVPDCSVAAEATVPNRIYSARELIRRAEEPGPFHNFPESFNADIFAGNRTVVSPSYTLYTKPGAISLPGKPIFGTSAAKIGGQGTPEIIGYTPSRTVDGIFEIGVKPSASGRTEVITHRFFRANE